MERINHPLSISRVQLFVSSVVQDTVLVVEDSGTRPPEEEAYSD